MPSHSHLDILGVQAFVAIAELGSFRAAANHMHLSESALGRRLAKLESSLGIRLVTRTTRTLTLSQEGAVFLPQARRVVQELASSLDSLRVGTGRRVGTLKIGCLPTIAALRMPSLLRAFARDYPDVRVQLFDRSATEIRRAVLEGEVDFAITVPGATHAKLESDKLFSEPMVAACPSGHRLARRASITWQDLSGEPLINIGMLSANRALIEAAMQKSALRLNWAYQVEHLATAVSLVSGGGIIAIVPASAVAERSDDTVRVLALRKPVVHREIVLLRRKLPQSEAADLFIELSKASLRG
ncbi:LysR family transcriptional regulator [Ottowia thiooxydans]|uniref:DNA-binding transcriptional LysR family regulator n=1 Tax=Ottowia thiooxydans TaxID=219182 RepID=A0ABV2QCB8_9BURK